MIDPQISEWISQILRWVHVITAIAWIGSSFYFIHLDLSLKKRDGLPEGVGGEAWQVHGGGFYNMRKYLVAPPELPKELTWFKWESYSHLDHRLLPASSGSITFTPISTRSIRPCAPSSPGRRRPSASAALVLSWLVYEGLCRSPLGRNGVVLGVVLFVYILARGLRLHPGLQRPRRLPPYRRDDRHLDVGQRLLRHHPEPEEGGGRACWPARLPTRSSARRPSSARRTTTT